MSVPIARSSHTIPPSQTTAPVHEFRVLYTHDLRRKQKRWQDGTLKYHTFNKRVMVYDTQKNFIGDTHWKEAEGLQDGDEVELEVGVMVQVGECVGREETDLRGLFERPRKDQQDGERPNEAADGSGRELSKTSRMTLGGNTMPPRRDYLRHKSLNSLLGTPKGALGKAALPTKSPYEIKHSTAAEDGRAAKRQKVGGEPAWNVTRTTTPVKVSKSKERPLLAGTSDARNKAASKTPAKKALHLAAGQRRLGVKEVIDISSDKDENIASDITLPDTPPILPTATPALKPRRTPTIPRSLRKATSPVAAVVEPRSPPVSTRNRITNVEVNVAPLNLSADEGFQDIEKILPLEKEKDSRLKPLKLVKQKPRNKLLCAKVLSRGDAAEKLGEAREDDAMEVERSPAKGKNTTDMSRTSAARSKSKRDSKKPIMEPERSPSSSPGFSTMRPEKLGMRSNGASHGPSRTEHEEVAVVHGIMEQRILPLRESPAKISDPRAFRRVQSENDADISLPLDELDSLPIEDEKQAANVGKKPIQRSLSENSGARKQQKGKVKAAGREAQEKEEKGPWTVEALDFFDWRPPDWEERQSRSFVSVAG